MRIAIVHTEPRSRERWVAAMRERLPHADVFAWPDTPEQAGQAPDRATDSGADGAADSAAHNSADYAVGWEPPADFFARQPRLKAFFSAAAGVDHLLRHPGLPAGLTLVRLEDAGMATQMAEYCCHEVFHLYLRRDEYAQQQRDGVWRVLLSPRRSQFPIGVLGLGVLGSEVARTLARFGYAVNGYSRTARSVEGIRSFSGDDGLEAFLRATRVLIVLAPLTAGTADLLDRTRLGWLQPGGWVINVARGGILVDEDLLAHIDSGHLAGATLDVFREEPLPAAHPFWRHPRIRMTPHVAALTLIGVSADQIAGKIERIERGEPVGGVVDRMRGY